MNFKLSVKAEAIQDMAEAFDRYENKWVGLGVEFLGEVEGFFDRITQNPEHYQSHRDQRIAVMHKFPHKMFMKSSREMIIVYAVYHDKRSPEKLTERT